MSKVSWDEYNCTLKTGTAKNMAEAYVESYGFLKTSLNTIKDRLKKVSRDYIEKILIIIDDNDKNMKDRINSVLADIDEYIDKIDKDLKEAEKTISPFRGNK